MESSLLLRFISWLIVSEWANMSGRVSEWAEGANEQRERSEWVSEWARERAAGGAEGMWVSGPVGGEWVGGGQWWLMVTSERKLQLPVSRSLIWITPLFTMYLDSPLPPWFFATKSRTQFWFYLYIRGLQTFLDSTTSLLSVNVIETSDHCQALEHPGHKSNTCSDMKICRYPIRVLSWREPSRSHKMTFMCLHLHLHSTWV